MERLCKNCRFIIVSDLSIQQQCAHPNNMTTLEDLVMGNSQRTYKQSCFMLRGISDKCGPTGAWFEPKDAVADVPPIPAPAPPPEPLRKAWSFPHMSLMSWLVLLAAEYYVILESLRLGVWLMNQPNDAAFVVGILVMTLIPLNAAGLGATLTRKFLLVKDK